MSEKFPANYHIFESLTAHVLEKHAPTKKAIIRENNKRHVSKELRKRLCIGQDLKILQIKVEKRKISGDINSKVTKSSR